MRNVAVCPAISRSSRISMKCCLLCELRASAWALLGCVIGNACELRRQRTASGAQFLANSNPRKRFRLASRRDQVPHLRRQILRLCGRRDAPVRCATAQQRTRKRPQPQSEFVTRYSPIATDPFRPRTPAKGAGCFPRSFRGRKIRSGPHVGRAPEKGCRHRNACSTAALGCVHAAQRPQL